jgi:putative oxygen-independent coproporphyrinogen III oxidase
MTPFGLYIHWPFCKAKCPYCDFNSHVRASIDDAAWHHALLAELRYWRTQTPNHVLHTIFFGGGTPSLMAPATVGALLDEAHKLWPAANDIEITLEANPTSVEAEKFAAFRAAGVNRVSIGVQSLRDDALKFLGRQHSGAEAKAAVILAQKHFARSSFDLIYARPQQTLAAWEAELGEAIAMAAGHLSLYQLTIEDNTGFKNLFDRGQLAMPDADTAGAFFETTQAITAAAGLPAYEISNHARVGDKSRHNLMYWNYGDYIGIGPGAHGRVNGAATLNEKMPEKWLNMVSAGGHGLLERTPITPEQARTEALLMGLRLTDGISRGRWHDKFGADITAHLRADKVQRLVDENYLVITDTHMTATADGRQRLQAVLDYLVN